MKVMLIGSADMSGQKVGGQYEKTRLIYKFLKKEKDIDLYFCNMVNNKRKLISLLSVIRGYKENDCIVLTTSTRGTRIISELLLILSSIKKKVIVYLVVGNQQELLQSFSKKKLNSIDKLYFEIDTMREPFRGKIKTGFFPNCKDIKYVKREYNDAEPFEICYYSEISYRKGFDRIVRALDVINKDEILYHLDVYGFFADDEREMKKYFRSRQYLSFKGVIKREESHKILSKYFLMVFPSRHKLEGLPGAIVDAYEAGLPVICSNIGFLPHVVKDYRTGFIFTSEHELIGNLTKIQKNPEMVEELRDDCLKEAQKYDVKKSVRMLHHDLDKLMMKNMV